MKGYLSILFSMRVSGLLLIVFAVSIGLATFVEYGSGTETARIFVYDSVWFKILLVLIALNLFGSIIINKLISRKRRSVFLFHLSFIIILVGAAVTRQMGSTGTMHIRENSIEQHYISDRRFVSIELSDGKVSRRIEKEVRFSEHTKNRFKETLSINDQSLIVENFEYLPSATRSIEIDDTGGPVISLLAMDKQKQRLEFILEKGEEKNFNNIVIGFEKTTDETTLLIKEKEGALVLMALNNTLLAESMGSEQTQLPIMEEFPLNESIIYQIGHIKLLLKQYIPKGRTRLVNGAPAYEANNDAFKARIKVGDQSAVIGVLGSRGLPGQPSSIRINGIKVSIAYGSVLRKLPFSLRLDDFRIERYPGSDSPSFLESEVTVLDSSVEREVPFRIFMNHTLKYKGYRFFQTSYDQDEKGTILSVNHDSWGTTITYLGYALMILGMLFSLIPKIFYRPLATH